MAQETSVGLIVVGDEILSGNRPDKHLAHVIQTLRIRGMNLGWYRIAGDDTSMLEETLTETQRGVLPVLCFGGIGATPDDCTREAAARAFGTRLIRNPKAVALIEQQFGAEAYPNRVKMADLPQDCLLILNPVNMIPGFTLYDHHFFPGFPNMAWPMLDWVLNKYYPAGDTDFVERSLRALNVKESDLFDLLHQLADENPEVKLFSLPHMAAENTIELGFRGKRNAVDPAFRKLVEELVNRAVSFESDDVAA